LKVNNFRWGSKAGKREGVGEGSIHGKTDLVTRGGERLGTWTGSVDRGQNKREYRGEGGGGWGALP